jgi:CheY-like chemotaxis protein
VYENNLIENSKEAKERVSINVILTENEAPLREMCAENLIDFGCHVGKVSNGALAINLINARNYDLLIIDMQMAELSGDELIGKIKMNPGLNLKIIVMAGGVNVELDNESFKDLESQVDAIINKPFRKEENYKVVKEKY